MWESGGESGIRTHVRVSPKHAFQACAFSHSAISPDSGCQRGACNQAFLSILWGRMRKPQGRITSERPHNYLLLTPDGRLLITLSYRPAVAPDNSRSPSR